MSSQIYYSIPITENEYELLKKISEIGEQYFYTSDLKQHFNEEELFFECFKQLCKKGIIQFDEDTESYFVSNVSDLDVMYFRFENQVSFLRQVLISHN